MALMADGCCLTIMKFFGTGSTESLMLPTNEFSSSFATATGGVLAGGGRSPVGGGVAT